MARDYSSRHDRDNRDKNGRPKTAKRSPKAAQPVRQKPAGTARKTRPVKTADRAPRGPAGSTPGWVWGLCGLFAGIVLVSGWYIFGRPAGTPGDTEQVDIAVPADNPTAGSSPDTSQSSNKTADSHGADTAADSAESQEKPRFSFYKMLPNYHVDIGSESSSASGPAEHAPHEAAEPDNEPRSVSSSEDEPTAKPSSSSSASAPDNDNDNDIRYVIQAGAFSAAADADRRKAQLALLGVTANVIDVTTASGRTVYRVQSDAVASAGKAQSLAQRLKSHGIETMVRQAD